MACDLTTTTATDWEPNPTPRLMTEPTAQKVQPEPPEIGRLIWNHHQCAQSAHEQCVPFHVLCESTASASEQTRRDDRSRSYSTGALAAAAGAAATLSSTFET